MERTPEQVAADNRLDEAIRANARAYDIIGDGEVISSWAVVAHAYGQDEGRSVYLTLHPGGVQPTHIAVGLFRMGERNMLDDEVHDE